MSAVKQPHVPDAAALDVVWNKSHYSNPSGECVELAVLPDGVTVAMRNSRDPHGPALLFSRQAVEDILDDARCGEDWIWDLVDDRPQALQGGAGAPESGPYPAVGSDHHR